MWSFHCRYGQVYEHTVLWRRTAQTIGTMPYTSYGLFSPVLSCYWYQHQCEGDCWPACCSL